MTILQSYPPHKLFCTYGTYVRYLRARQWNLHKAGKMLKDTLAWREQYKPEEITWDEIKSEAELKKVTILDQFDKDGRPVVFMRPRNEVPGGANDLKLKYVVYVMERASSIADACGTLVSFLRCYLLRFHAVHVVDVQLLMGR